LRWTFFQRQPKMQCHNTKRPRNSAQCSSATLSMGGGGDLGSRQHGDVPCRRATAICALLRAVGMFIDS
jgi:hypothetical protein